MKTATFRELLIAGAIRLFLPLLAISADAASSATDPLTNLPLYPGALVHGDPMKMHDAAFCESKYAEDFYGVQDAKVDATISWCVSNLTGFKRTRAYVGGRSHDSFYNAEGTIVVSVLGSPGKDGDNPRTHSISYFRFTPGVAEKTIIGFNEQRIVCP
jgi:hypothetical protein